MREKDKMRILQELVLAVSILTICTYAENESVRNRTRQREGKVFSLFSIVSFINTDCFTTSSISGANGPSRLGSCFTQSECVEEKGGKAAGVCAAGFGVCCLFTTDQCGDTVTQNNTYVRNPGFPDEYDDLDDCSFNVRKISPDICTLRLDFESFTLAGPSITDTTDETKHEPFGGLCDQDLFTVDATGSASIPFICGINEGQHIYVDVSGGGDGTAVLQFEFPNGDQVSLDRDWEVRVAQIPCGANYRPPAGCLQYFTGISGQVKTFNYDSTDTPHLGNQRYSACIRREAGFCCNEYIPCREDTDSFTLDTIEADPMAFNEEVCLGDHIRIEGGSATCQRVPSFTVNKFCGTLLSTTADADVANDIVCDCSAPFAIDIFTDDLGDNLEQGEDAENQVFSRGACLEWTQVPC